MPRAIQPLLATLALALLSSTAHAYVDLAPTIPKLLADSKSVSLVQISSFDRTTRTLNLKEIKTLKGDPISPTADITHILSAADPAPIPRPILQWAQPSAQAVLFYSPRTALVCIGPYWYQVKRLNNEWKLGVERPELPLSYYGSVPRLSDGIAKILAGKDAILTAMPHGVEQGASFDAALNTAAFPGLVKLQRFRANLNMPTVVFSVSNNPAYMIGMGPADEKDLPILLNNLASPDPNTRAQSADDLRQLADTIGTTKLAPALAPLQPLLADPAARTRFAAAAAIVRISRDNHEKPLNILAEGLNAKDPDTRRAAAQFAGLTGSHGTSLVQPLANLLKDPDESILISALQSLATLGPVAVASRGSITALLDNPNYAIDAADALGRLGPRAQPIPPQLTKLLDSNQPPVRWAALRGMSQIGGTEAIPAAQYIAKEIGNCSETDAYNMVIYLALIGPPARQTAATIKNLPIMNPVLPLATNWAMNPEAALPWQNNALDNFGDVGNFIFAAYVNGLGERLQPAALKLAPLLFNNQIDEDIPDWAYKILNAAPAQTLPIIAHHLQDPDKPHRERAAVILGHMGPPAHNATEQVQQALQQAADPKEKNLLTWTLTQISQD